MGERRGGAPTAGAAIERNVLGGLLAAVGALAYAVTIVIGRVLAQAGIPSAVGLGLRFGIAGLALVVGLLATRRSLVPARGERLAAVLLGTVGYAVESTFFYLGLTHGSAAAVALLFYSYPVLVALAEIPLRGVRPRPSTAVALVLSAAGAATVAAGGGRVDITPVGIGYSLASAATFAVYLLAGERWTRRTDPVTMAAWVALGASASLLARAALTGGVVLPPGHAWQLLAYGAATGIAFACMFAALQRLGPSPTAVVMTLEALFAVVLGALVLDEPVGALEAVGGAGVLVGAVIISFTRSAPVEPAPEAAPP